MWDPLGNNELIYLTSQVGMSSLASLASGISRLVEFEACLVVACSRMKIAWCMQAGRFHPLTP